MSKGKNMETKKKTFAQLRKELGKYLGVTNAPSRNGRNTAPNQFIFHYANGEVFQSYDSICGVMLDGDRLYLGKDHDLSVTTNRFVGHWCGFSKQERLKGIANGTFGVII